VRATYLALGLLASVSSSSWAAADKTAAVERKVIETSPIAGTDEELQLMLVTFPPSAASVPHVHPVVGLNYIIEGEVDTQYEGEPVKHFHTGDSYQDEVGKKHLVFKNTSATKPLRFLIAVKIKKGVPFKKDL
jgi:quercetin dioxygenase-like cupin family protein